jgi:hypothetical protein
MTKKLEPEEMAAAAEEEGYTLPSTAEFPP